MILGYPDAVIERLNEGHGIHSTCDAKPALGEQIAIVPNHACMISNLHDEFVLSAMDAWAGHMARRRAGKTR